MRERLEKIADGISVHSIAGVEQRKLLLRLASQEHRGEEAVAVSLGEALNDILWPFAATKAGACPNFAEVPEECDCITCKALVALRESEDALTQHEEREELTRIALALKNQGIEDCTPERGVELLIERLYAQRGEVERLRERLLRACEERSHKDPDGFEYVYLTGIEAALEDALPPPSDSQGDQGRCEIENCPKCGCRHYPWNRCGISDEAPDCDPAPTPQHDYEQGEETLIDRASADPAPTQVEGDEYEGDHPLHFSRPPTLADLDSIAIEDLRPEAVRQADPDAYAKACKLRRQPEGGDEEDWPEATFGRCAQWGFEHIDSPETKAQFMQEPDVRFCRYLPATSQDSSGLEEHKAPGDRLHKLCLELADEKEAVHGRREQAEARAERAETALEELGDEFVQRAEGDYPDKERAAYAAAALLAREKAAKLKEGG